jgi:hypothetical protein
VKQRIYPMLGFKKFDNAAIAISGDRAISVEDQEGAVRYFSGEREEERVSHVLEAVLAG